MARTTTATAAQTTPTPSKATPARQASQAVLLAVMPYCMIHFGKPMPETLGAIFAGIALGTLSLFTRSIWLGVAIHVSVAVSMDLISLWLAGRLF